MKKLFAVMAALILTGCQPHVPSGAFELPPENLQDRQLQTRRFETTDKQTMLAAASAVLQDLGFTLEETEPRLGVLVGSKDRDATSGAQVASAILIAVLGGGAMPIDSTQTIRVSMVMRELNSAPGADSLSPSAARDLTQIQKQIEDAIAGKLQHIPQADRKKAAKELAGIAASSIAAKFTRLAGSHDSAGESIVRVTFQRIIFNTQGDVTRAEQIKDTEVYKDFFEKLSKSVFLEAHEI